MKSDLESKQEEAKLMLTRAEEQRDHFRAEAITYYEDFEKNLKSYTANFEKKFREAELAKTKIAKDYESKLAQEATRKDQELAEI